MSRKYTQKIQLEVLGLHKSGETVLSISESTGVPRNTIYGWIKNAVEEAEAKAFKPSD